jgi:hypothetical protein
MTQTEWRRTKKACVRQEVVCVVCVCASLIVIVITSIFVRNYLVEACLFIGLRAQILCRACALSTRRGKGGPQKRPFQFFHFFVVDPQRRRPLPIDIARCFSYFFGTR